MIDKEGVIVDFGGHLRAYNHNGIPVFVLVDPEGIIKDIQLGHYDGLLRKLTADIE